MSSLMAYIDPKLAEKIDAFIRDLREDQIHGSFAVAIGTLHILRAVIGEGRWRRPTEIVALIREEGRRIRDVQPSLTVISNMTGRVLKIIRDECKRLISNEKSTTAAENLGLQKLTLNMEPEYMKHEVPDLRGAVIDAVNEVISELEISESNISAQALQHIFASEVILTAGRSRTVESFLKAAAKKRKFMVIVAECAPFNRGHDLAKSLADDGIETLVISDAAVFAVMPKVSKVIIGTQTVLANGGLKSICGTYAVAQCAKYLSVPVIVCTAIYKFSQKHYCEGDFNKFYSPEAVLPFEEGAVACDVQVYNPVFDYVPPNLVTSYVTDVGGHATAYAYRFIQEFYCIEDNEFV